MFTFISYFKYLTYRIVYLKIWVRFCTTLNTGTDFASDNRSANSFILNHRSRPFTEIFSLKFVCLLGLTLCSSIVLISHILLDSNKRKIQIYIYIDLQVLEHPIYFIQLPITLLLKSSHWCPSSLTSSLSFSIYHVIWIFSLYFATLWQLRKISSDFF